ncbi:MAG: FAD-dependent monooxygenase [Opitutales bacterium]
MAESPPLTSPDVLLVGAGPVGLTLAGELLRRGVSVRLLERHSAPFEGSRAFCVQARTLEVLNGLGVTEQLLTQGTPIRGMRVYAEGKLLLQAGLTGGTTRYDFALDLPQLKLEEALKQRVAELGCVPECPRTLMDFTADAEGVTARVTKPTNGGVETIRARYLIGCDGSQSTVRTRLGIPTEATAPRVDFNAMDVHLRWSEDPQQWHLFFHPRGSLFCYPMEGDVWRMLLEADAGAAPARISPKDLLARMGQVGAPPAKVQAVFSSQLYPVFPRIARQFQQGRVFLAGDAAHVHHPVGSHGMNSGLQDAVNLAWKIACVVHGLADDSLLDTYHVERREACEEAVRLASRMHRLGILEGSIGAGLRDRLVPLLANTEFFQERARNSLEVLDITYPHSPLSRQLRRREALSPFHTHSRHLLAAGVRLPDLPVTAAVSGAALNLHRLLGESALTALVFLHSTENENLLGQVDSILHRVHETQSNLLKAYVISGRRPPPALTPWIEQIFLDVRHRVHRLCQSLHRPTLIVARTDGYAGLVAAPPTVKALEDYLADYFKPVRSAG